MDPERKIIWDLTQHVGKRVARKTIRHLQQLEAGLSGDNSGLKNVWDEFCIQVQDEDSFFRESYDDLIESSIKWFIEELPSHEQGALYLQTDGGMEWLYDDPEEHAGTILCDYYEIARYIFREFLIPEADEWSNERIRYYLGRIGPSTY